MKKSRNRTAGLAVAASLALANPAWADEPTPLDPIFVSHAVTQFTNLQQNILQAKLMTTTKAHFALRSAKIENNFAAPGARPQIFMAQASIMAKGPWPLFACGR